MMYLPGYEDGIHLDQMDTYWKLSVVENHEEIYSAKGKFLWVCLLRATPYFWVSVKRLLNTVLLLVGITWRIK